jgi:hypothetical protein
MRASRTRIAHERGGATRRRTQRAALAVSIALVVLVSACGDIEDQSMCAAYDDFLVAGAAIQELDPATLTAADAADEAQAFLDSVRHLEETADDRHDALFAALEAAARDVVLTLESVGDQSDYSTWAPLVEDDLGVAADAAVSVENALEPQCPSSGGDS